MDKKTREEGTEFSPLFDDQGLIPCITMDHTTRNVLMMAYMNKEALTRTLETREMHYWSRSRQELWHKGASSGAVQNLIEIRTDCDQDCLLAYVEVNEKHMGDTCHTGRETCFYRRIDTDTKTLIFDEE